MTELDTENHESDARNPFKSHKKQRSALETSSELDVERGLYDELKTAVQERYPGACDGTRLGIPDLESSNETPGWCSSSELLLVSI